MAIIRTRTRTNTTTIEQPANQRNKEFHMEDQTDLSSIVWRVQAQVSKMQKHHAEKVVAFWCENARLWGAHRSLGLTYSKGEKPSQPQSAYPKLLIQVCVWALFPHPSTPLEDSCCNLRTPLPLESWRRLSPSTGKTL